MATLAQVKSKANPLLLNLKGKIDTWEDRFYAKHGRYFQLLVTPSTKVQDGADVDLVVRHPSDVVAPHEIELDVQWGQKYPFQIEVQTHQLGDVWDYTIRVQIEVNGITYERQVSKNGLAPTYNWRRLDEENV